MARNGAAEVTVVVVTWNQRELVLACLQSLVRQTIPCHILVVDNASSDGSADAVQTAVPAAEIIRLTENTGFAGGVAAALPRVRTRFVALLNNDAVADPRWLEESLAQLDDPTVAAVAAKMLLLDDEPADEQPPTTPERVNNAGVVLLVTGYGADRGLGEADTGALTQPAEVFGFSGGAAVLRTMAVLAVGGISPEWFMYYEDTDLAWRLRLAGWRVVYEPTAVVHHRHAVSSDVRSEMFAFFNERNRLLTLARNAPTTVTARAAGRFVVTTVSLSAKRLLGRSVPPEPVFDPSLRLRVMARTLKAWPGVARERHEAPRQRSRREVWREWSGVPARPPHPGGKPA